MQSGSKRQSPLIFILPLIILFAAGFSYWFIKLKTSQNDTITNTSTLNNQVSLASVELDREVGHFLSTKQKIEFDYPSIFGIVEKNNGQIIVLTSLYYVLPDPINPSIPANEALPPHYFSMSFETRDLPLEEAMKQENPYFSETYLNLKTSAKKPIPDYPLEIKKNS